MLGNPPPLSPSLAKGGGVKERGAGAPLTPRGVVVNYGLGHR